MIPTKINYVNPGAENCRWIIETLRGKFDSNICWHKIHNSCLANNSLCFNILYINRMIKTSERISSANNVLIYNCLNTRGQSCVTDIPKMDLWWHVYKARGSPLFRVCRLEFFTIGWIYIRKIWNKINLAKKKLLPMGKQPRTSYDQHWCRLPVLSWHLVVSLLQIMLY